MDDSFFLLVLIVIAALAFGFSNGLNDAANAIATVIGTRVLSPRNAIIMAAFFNFLGPLTGTAVARTIGKGIVMPEALTLGTVIAGVAAAIIWVVAATRFGIPLSVSHSLVAGLLGAGIAAAGTDVIVWGVLNKVLLAVVFAPLLGFAAGFAAMAALMWLFRRTIPARVSGIFSNLQILSAAFMAYAHGKNDGQMPIGIIALGLMIYYSKEQFDIPLWVIIASATSISLGTAFGGWRVIRTLGLKITSLRPVHGFAAEASAATVIEAASILGIPVSTTQCISGSIMGVGSTRRLSAVRWGIARNIVVAWVITFPICAGLGWLLEKALGLIG